METLFQDLRYGVRMALKLPAFTAVAVITLALGIGANTAVFSIVNGVLLNPLPFLQADQLVGLGENKANFENGSISYPSFHDWQKDNRSFSSMAVSRDFSFNLIGVGKAEQVEGDLVSSDFFSILGVKPVTGRLFMAGEDEVGAAPVALIGEGLRRRKFSFSPDIVGKSITLGPKGYTVVGIIPASFHLSLPSFLPRIVKRKNCRAPGSRWLFFSRSSKNKLWTSDHAEENHKSREGREIRLPERDRVLRGGATLESKDTEYAPPNGFNKFGFLSGVSKCVPELANGHCQAMVKVDERIRRPKALAEFVTGDDLPG
jgi:hypothetical protein